jgi:hypothetical protein
LFGPGDDVDEDHEIVGVEVGNTVLTREHVQDELVNRVGGVPKKTIQI